MFHIQLLWIFHFIVPFSKKFFSNHDEMPHLSDFSPIEVKVLFFSIHSSKIKKNRPRWALGLCISLWMADNQLQVTRQRSTFLTSLGRRNKSLFRLDTIHLLSARSTFQNAKRNLQSFFLNSTRHVPLVNSKEVIWPPKSRGKSSAVVTGRLLKALRWIKT